MINNLIQSVLNKNCAKKEVADTIQDKYAKELERAVFNIYYCGEDTPQKFVFNAVRYGLENDMQILVPVSDNKICGSLFDEKDGYFIPVFTSYNESDKGENSQVINRPLKDLFDEIDSLPDCSGCIINRWSRKLIMKKDMIHELINGIPESHIYFIRGSITEIHTGAIVNAANKSLSGGGGADGAIHKAAGRGLYRECMKLHGCGTGKAKITGAYNINHADYIIHTVGPVYSGLCKDAQFLSACYKNSLDLAFERGCMSIAFPCISAGAYGYPVKEAAAVSLNAVTQWIDAHPGTAIDIYFCCYKDSEFKAYMELSDKNNQV